MSNRPIGFETALQLTFKAINPLRSETVPISDAVGFVTAEEVVALIDTPSANISLRDGYAIQAADVSQSKIDHPVSLTIIGSAAAGQKPTGRVRPGTAMRILTGARLPEGADAVIADEFIDVSNGHIGVTNAVSTGNNILAQGKDVAIGDILVDTSACLTPGRIGLMAAGGLSSVRVFKKPEIALIATGDEVQLPGEKIAPGNVYASNLLTISSWCQHYGFKTKWEVVGDHADRLRQIIWRAAQEQDAIVTSGGAWKGDRDLMAGVLDGLSWKKIFHRIRLVPGKAFGFGLLNQRPLFMLPGGPPSNLAAFLLLALPGLQKMYGLNPSGLPQIPAVVQKRIVGKTDETRVKFGELYLDDGKLQFVPHRSSMSRLKSLAEARGLLLIPEGIAEFTAGKIVNIRLLNHERNGLRGVSP